MLNCTYKWSAVSNRWHCHCRTDTESDSYVNKWAIICYIQLTCSISVRSARLTDTLLGFVAREKVKIDGIASAFNCGLAFLKPSSDRRSRTKQSSAKCSLHSRTLSLLLGGSFSLHLAIHARRRATSFGSLKKLTPRE